MSGYPAVVVTGAARGMGRKIAAAFAAGGAAVCLADRNGEEAEAAAQESRGQGGKVVAIRTDITLEQEVIALMRTAREQLGPVTVLVNTAGGYGKVFRSTHETPEDEWDMVLNSNLKGSFLCAKHAIPMMLEAGSGRIINFSSNAGRTVSPLLGCSYTAAKAGVIGLTRHLSREYASRGILVNTIAPGPIAGDRVVDMVGDQGAADLSAQIPLGRLGQPEEVVAAVLFLASPAASFITGAILDINGGYVLA